MEEGLVQKFQKGDFTENRFSSVQGNEATPIPVSTEGVIELSSCDCESQSVRGFKHDRSGHFSLRNAIDGTDDGSRFQFAHHIGKAVAAANRSVAALDLGAGLRLAGCSRRRRPSSQVLYSGFQLGRFGHHRCPVAVVCGCVTNRRTCQNHLAEPTERGLAISISDATWRSWSSGLAKIASSAPQNQPR